VEPLIGRRISQSDKWARGSVKLFTIVAVSGEPGAFQFVARDAASEIDVFVLSNAAGPSSISIRGSVIDPVTLIARARRAINGTTDVEQLVGRRF
jgi:hypothetical protein